MGYCLVEKPKTHSPRCEWNFDSTSCDHGRDLTAQVSHCTRLLAATILTHSEVLISFSSEALSIVLRNFEVEELMNAGHAGARCVSQRCCEVGMYVGARGREQLVSWNEIITMACENQASSLRRKWV